MDFTQYINPELLVLVPVLLIIGKFIKSSLGNVDNRHIPMMLGILGIGFAATWVTATMDVVNVAQAVFTAAVQGLLCAGMAVYGHELVKQSKGE